MIWSVESDPSPVRDAVREHLRGQLQGDVGGRITHPSILDDVAAVVATAWQEDFRGTALPPGALSLMAVRTMWEVGEVDAARALMDGMTRQVDEAERLWELVEAGGPTLLACVGLGAGILRPSRTAIGGDSPCWTLDVTCLTSSAGHLAELDLPARLRHILARTAEIWDRAAGGGVLTIARPSRQASAHLARLIRDEVPGVCRLIFQRIQADRGWGRCPAVYRQALL